MNGVDNPVDARVAADSLVLRVDEDNLEVLVGRVLVNPVGVEDTEVGTSATDTLLGGGLERTLVLQLADTLVGGLAVCDTLGYGSLAATTTNADAVDDEALLGLVSQSAGLVRARRTRSAVDDVQLSVLAEGCSLSKCSTTYTPSLRW